MYSPQLEDNTTGLVSSLPLDIPAQSDIPRTDFLAPPKHKNSLSYFAGWMAVAGWISLVATGSSLGANFITGWVVRCSHIITSLTAC
jgi:hypothetical protein